MKLGAENKTQLVAAIVLGLGALASVGRWIATSPSKNTAHAAIVVAKRDASNRVLVTSLDPQLRLDLLKISENVKYEGGGRNIFLANSEPEVIPPTVVPPLKPGGPGGPGPTTPPGPKLPDPPPPIDLKFFGFASRPGEPTKIFLSHGENIFVAREGDIVDRQFKVGKISAGSVEIEDMLHNNKQPIPLTRS